MAGDRATFARIKLKELGAGFVGFQQDLVFADCFAGDDGVQERPFCLAVSMMMRKLSGVKDTHMNLLRNRASESGKSGQHFRL